MDPPPEVPSQPLRADDQASHDSSSPESSNGNMYTPQHFATQYAVPRYLAPQYPAPQYPVPQYLVPQYPVLQYPVPQYPVPQYPVPQYTVPQYTVPQYPSFHYPGPYFMAPRPGYPVLSGQSVERPHDQWRYPGFIPSSRGYPSPTANVYAPMYIPQQQMYPQQVSTPNSSCAPHKPAPTNFQNSPPVVNVPEKPEAPHQHVGPSKEKPKSPRVITLTHKSSEFCALGKLNPRPGVSNDTGPPMTSDGFSMLVRHVGPFDATGLQPGLFLSKTKHFALLVVQNVFVLGSRKVEVWGRGGQYHIYDTVGVLGDDSAWLLGDNELVQKNTGNYSGIVEGIEEVKRRVSNAKVGKREKKKANREMKVADQEDKVADQEDKVADQEDKVADQEDKVADQEENAADQEENVTVQEEVAVQEKVAIQ